MPNTAVPADGEAMPAATDKLDLLELRDEWGRLESRIRFYAAGAEAIASDERRLSAGGSILRATDDLLDFVEAFEEMFDAYRKTMRHTSGEEADNA